LYYRDEVSTGFCDTLYDCLKHTLSYGFQNGGGIGDTFDHSTGVRLILDLSFFVVVLVVLLNVFLGMIIDTFSSLRADKLERLRDTNEVCFICNIDKQVFDRASDEPEGFKTHIKIDHNMWNYLYFIFLLWEQDRDDDDGLEQYVRRAIDANEIVWFPMHKAIRLNQAATKEESLLNSLMDKSKRAESEVANKLDRFQTDINTVLEQLNQTLKGDHIMDRQDASRAVTGKGTRQSLLMPDGSLVPAARSVNRKMIKALYAGIREISCALFKRDKYRFAVYCNVYFEQSMFTIKGLPAEGEVVRFPEDEAIALVEGVVPGDERMVTFQVMCGQGSSDDDEEIGLFYLSVDDIFVAEGCYADYFVDLDDKTSRLKMSVQSLVSLIPA